VAPGAADVLGLPRRALAAAGVPADAAATSGWRQSVLDAVTASVSSAASIDDSRFFVKIFVEKQSACSYSYASCSLGEMAESYPPFFSPVLPFFSSVLVLSH
jgi:hypothetical protein